MPRAELSKSKIKDGMNSFKAEKIFTDREEPRKAFWNAYEEVNNNSETYKVISYYGIGGLGKTTLIEKLAEEMRAKKKKYVSLNFEYSESMSKVLILRELGSKLFALDKNAFKFYRFRTALKRYADETSQDIEIKNDNSTFLSSNPLCDLALDLTDSVPDILDKAPIVSTISRIVSILNKSVEVVKNSIDTKNMKTSLLKIRDYEQMSKLIDDLEVYFYEDLAEGMVRFNQPLVIFLDTYEKFADYFASNDFQSNEDWLKKIVSKPQGILWVFAGREMLKWEDKFEAEQHLLENLSFKDAKDFLVTAGINESLIEGIYNLTDGNPVFLDICVDTNTDLINQGITPKLEDFGENQAKLIERHSKYMDTDVLELAYLLAYIGKWKTEEILAIKEKTNIVKISVTEYNNFLEHSFVIKDNNGYYMTNIVRKAFYENIPKELMKEFEKVLYSHAQEKIESKKNSIEIVEETTNYTNRFINHIDEPSEENLKRYDEIRKEIYELFNKGLYKEGIERFNSFSRYFKNKDDSYIKFKIKADVDQAYIYYFIGNYSKAIELLLSLQLTIQKVYEELSLQNLDVLKKIAQNYYENQEYIDAVKFYYKVFLITKKVYGENNIETIIAFEDALYHSYKKREALDFSYEKINVNLEDKEKCILDNYQLDTIDLNDKNGIEVIEKIYNKKLKVLGMNHEDVIKTNVKLGEALSLWYGNHMEDFQDNIFHKKNYNKDYYDCAKKLKLFFDNCNKNYQSAIKLYGQNGKKTLEAYKNLCEAYVIMYDSKGLKKYRKLYKKYIEIYGEYHHKTIEILIKIYTIYLKEFNVIKAQKIGKEVCEKCKKVYGEDSAITKKVLSESKSIKTASETAAQNHNLGKILSGIAFGFMNFIVKIQYKMIHKTLKKQMKQMKK